MAGAEAEASEVCSSLSLWDVLQLNAVEVMIAMGSTSELLEEDQSLSLWLGLFPGWLCRDSKTRVQREAWGECRVTWFTVDNNLYSYSCGCPFLMCTGQLVKELQGLFEALNISWVINVSNHLSSVGTLFNRCLKKNLNRTACYEQRWLSGWETCVFIFTEVWSFSLVFVMALCTLGNPFL